MTTASGDGAQLGYMRGDFLRRCLRLREWGAVPQLTMVPTTDCASALLTTVEAECNLPPGHQQINIGKQLRVEQRAV